MARQLLSDRPARPRVSPWPSCGSRERGPARVDSLEGGAMRKWTVSLIELEQAKVSVTVAIGETGVLVLPEIMLAGVTVGVAVGRLGIGEPTFTVDTPSVRGCRARVRAVLDHRRATVELFVRADYPGSYLEVEDGVVLGDEL